MTDSAETATPVEASSPTDDSALCRVIYVRVTPKELAKLKSIATTAKLSLQRHARITLGLTDRGGYRNRKERLNGQTKTNAELQGGSRNNPIPTQAKAQT